MHACEVLRHASAQRAAGAWRERARIASGAAGARVVAFIAAAADRSIGRAA
jgi:hypothetical protein